MKRAIKTRLIDVADEERGPPRTLSEAIYRRFRQDILWGKLPPDAPLRSDELRLKYNIGISPLREALSRLVSEQLVTASGQRGFRVAPLTVADVIDTMETRLVIESEALIRSIRSTNIAWETGVIGSHHTLSRMDVPNGPGEQAEAWTKFHREFHMALLAGCGSRWLLKLAGSLFDQAERHRVLGFNSRTRIKRSDPASEHRQIMEAALGGNTKAAVSGLEYHYRTTADLVAKELSSRSESSDSTFPLPEMAGASTNEVEVAPARKRSDKAKI